MNLLEDVLRQIAAEGTLVTRGAIVEYLNLSDTLVTRRQITRVAKELGFVEWRGETDRWLVPPGVEACRSHKG